MLFESFNVPDLNANVGLSSSSVSRLSNRMLSSTFLIVSIVSTSCAICLSASSLLLSKCLCSLGYDEDDENEISWELIDRYSSLLTAFDVT